MAGKSGRKTFRPATSPEQRESQLISLASDLAERRLRDGTASAQETTFFLKLGSSRERLEQEKLHKETVLLSARVDQISSGARMEELYEEALKAMRGYSGQDPGYGEDDDYYGGR